jgi:two-component system, chemotaxis family, chemotaxis protein CheY
LLDLHLSDVSGEAFLRQLRADARTRSIPAVIVRGDTAPATIERLAGLGAAAYLTKPFTSAQLRELISALGGPAGEGTGPAT